MQHPQRGLGCPSAWRGERGAARRADGAGAFHVVLASSALVVGRLGMPVGQLRGPVTDSAAATAAPSATSWTAASISGARKRSVPGRRRTGAQQRRDDGAGRRAPASSGARRSMRAGGGQQLDRQHAGEAVDRAAQLAGGRPAHRDVVLLHRRARDRVDRGRDREPLQLGDDRGLGVLRDHVAAVDARVVGEERRQAVVARDVEEAVGAPLARSRPGRRRRSRGSRARRRPARRGSCRWTRPGRRG